MVDLVNSEIDNSVYDKLPNLVLGFHGCNEETWNNVLHRHENLKRSENSYDWLGNGIYFWENSYERAADWARNRYGDKAAVVGAVLDLGHCLNLTDYKSSMILKAAYESLRKANERKGIDMPVNSYGRSDVDLLLRNLDCMVIEHVHTLSKMEATLSPFDSVRGVFTEGKSVYPGAGIPEKTHIQICIVNPNCIKGYFAPMIPDAAYPVP